LGGGLAAGRRRRPRVDQLSGDWLYSKVEAFQCACAQQHEVAGLSEHDVVTGSFASDMDKRTADPALENGSVCLAEVPLVVPLNAQGLEQLSRDP
jgi:hypothetical protein